MHRNNHLFASFVFCAVIAVVVPKCTADASWFSSCPNVEPVRNLSIDNLLGIWYRIQATSDKQSYVVYNITKDTSHDGLVDKYLLTEIEQRKPFLFGRDYEHRSVKKLTVPYRSGPLAIGTTKLTVFITDYQHYMGIFTCKPHFLGLVHSWSAEILSRTPTLDIEYIDIVRTRLATNNVDPFFLSYVSLKNCPTTCTQGSDDETTTNIFSNSDYETTTLADDKDKQPAGREDKDSTDYSKRESSETLPK